MSFETDLFAALVASDVVDERVYPVVLPQGVSYPAITYQRVSTARIRAHEGTSLVGPLFQVTCWHTSPVVARDVKRGVVEALEGTYQCLVENTLEMFEPETKLTKVIIDVRLWAGLEEEVTDAS